MSDHLSNIKAYLEQLTARPRQMSDIIHGVHFKGDTGAELTESDLRQLVNDAELFSNESRSLATDALKLREVLRSVRDELMLNGKYGAELAIRLINETMRDIYGL